MGLFATYRKLPNQAKVFLTPKAFPAMLFDFTIITRVLCAWFVESCGIELIADNVVICFYSLQPPINCERGVSVLSNKIELDATLSIFMPRLAFSNRTMSVYNSFCLLPRSVYTLVQAFDNGIIGDRRFFILCV